MYLIGRYQDGEFVDYAMVGTNRRIIRAYDTWESAIRGIRGLGTAPVNKGYELKIMEICQVKEVD